VPGTQFPDIFLSRKTVPGTFFTLAAWMPGNLLRKLPRSFAKQNSAPRVPGMEFAAGRHGRRLRWFMSFCPAKTQSFKTAGMPLFPLLSASGG
jgi:hypothetical protein